MCGVLAQQHSQAHCPRHEAAASPHHAFYDELDADMRVSETVWLTPLVVCGAERLELDTRLLQISKVTNQGLA